MHTEFGDWLPAFLQVTDSAYPTGAFSHSGGLEGMITLKLVYDEESLRQYLRADVVSSLLQVDLPLLRLAAAGDLKRLRELDLLCQSLKSTAELRLNSSRVGRRRLGLLRQYSDSVELYQSSLPFAHLAVVAGIEAAILQIPLRSALAGYSFQVFSGTLAASMKLLRIGQTVVQGILTEMCREIPKLVECSLEVAEQDLGFSNPFLDIASSRHERAGSRLFLS